MRTDNICCWIVTKKDEMETGNEDRLRWSKKSSNMESRPQHWMQSSRAVRRPRKRWEDDVNQFFKLEETEETKGNDVKNNDTWIRVAKD